MSYSGFALILSFMAGFYVGTLKEPNKIITADINHNGMSEQFYLIEKPDSSKDTTFIKIDTAFVKIDGKSIEEYLK